MVTHFTKLPSHGFAVRTLYRNLLKEARRALPDNSTKAESLITDQFQKNKRLSSPWRCRDELTRGNSIYETLSVLLPGSSNASQSGSPDAPNTTVGATEDVVSSWPIIEKLISDAENYSPVHYGHRKNIMNFPKVIEPSLNPPPPSTESRDAHAKLQSDRTRVLNYLRLENPGTWGREVDIDITASKSVDILKKLAHRQSMRRLGRLRYIFRQRGPYKIRKYQKWFSYHGSMYQFLRLPWSQNPKTSIYLQQLRKFQDLLVNMHQQRKEILKWCTMEAAWEYRISGKQDREYMKQLKREWSYGFMSTISYNEKKYGWAMKKCRAYNKRINSQKQKYQELMNKWHIEKLEKFEKLETYLKENDVKHDSSPSLGEVMRQFGFKGN
ncbi:hypothetical protein DASC09_019760 [Saccharomycopsis crataegensis]|uniref:Complex 1 LYR protein domain-containing protein n=1 Tax=Saccharomycopsis crataegensis TaxID=43959 RepID=A0AAV5QJ52_9ASCO|nr:hypothetical protein DASC09_019760 [Saccharomycopsis crataegensis]